MRVVSWSSLSPISVTSDPRDNTWSALSSLTGLKDWIQWRNKTQYWHQNAPHVQLGYISFSGLETQIPVHYFFIFKLKHHSFKNRDSQTSYAEMWRARHMSSKGAMVPCFAPPPSLIFCHKSLHAHKCPSTGTPHSCHKIKFKLNYMGFLGTPNTKKVSHTFRSFIHNARRCSGLIEASWAKTSTHCFKSSCDIRLSWVDVQAEEKVPLMSAQLGTGTAQRYHSVHR